MSEQWSLWTRNVIDKYKNWSTDAIRRDLQETANPFSVCMEHWQGDFNISTLIRNSNAFNVKKVYYLGKKRFDRRGTVGTHHYVDLSYLDDGHKRLVDLKKEYTFVAIDNNVGKTEKLHNFNWNKLQKPPLFFFGEEGAGLTTKVLNLCDYTIEIEQHGSVRSMNVGTCSGIVLYAYATFLKSSTSQRNAVIAKCDASESAQSESYQLTLL